MCSVTCTNTYIGVTQVTGRRWGGRGGTNLVVGAQGTSTAELVQEAPTNELLERVFLQNKVAVCKWCKPFGLLGGTDSVRKYVIGNWLVCWSKSIDVVKPAHMRSRLHLTDSVYVPVGFSVRSGSGMSRRQEVEVVPVVVVVEVGSFASRAAQPCDWCH